MVHINSYKTSWITKTVSLKIFTLIDQFYLKCLFPYFLVIIKKDYLQSFQDYCKGKLKNIDLVNIIATKANRVLELKLDSVSYI